MSKTCLKIRILTKFRFSYKSLLFFKFIQMKITGRSMETTLLLVSVLWTAFSPARLQNTDPRTWECRPVVRKCLEDCELTDEKCVKKCYSLMEECRAKDGKVQRKGKGGKEKKEEKKEKSSSLPWLIN